jgi:hypothetical protein
MYTECDFAYWKVHFSLLQHIHALIGHFVVTSITHLIFFASLRRSRG